MQVINTIHINWDIFPGDWLMQTGCKSMLWQWMSSCDRHSVNLCDNEIWDSHGGEY
jgi:hypothetical protein